MSFSNIDRVSEYEVHQVGPKDSGSQNFSFLAFKGEAENFDSHVF
jgi:hypothetical protein